MAYKDYKTSFEHLLKMDDTTNIYQQNLKTLATEVHKISQNLSHHFIRELFTEK